MQNENAACHEAGGATMWSGSRQLPSQEALKRAVVSTTKRVFSS